MLFTVETAHRYACEGRIEEWIHAYLTTPDWANRGLSRIIRHQKPIWVGPVEVGLTQLRRCCGPEEGMRYHEELEHWERRLDTLVGTLHDPLLLPPLLVRHADGLFDVPDGNHRLEAMRRKGWRTGWALVWCDRDPSHKGSWRADRA